MSRGGSEQPSLWERSIPVKWFLVMIGGLVVVLAVVVVVVALVARDGAGPDEALAAGPDSATAVTSPFDLVEVGDDLDLDRISDAAFVSICLADESGRLTSYGVSCDLPAAQELMQAIRDAKEADGASAGASGAGDSTLTFVLPSRETVTFGLVVDQGLIVRGGQAWRPSGDLAALVAAAIKSPQ